MYKTVYGIASLTETFACINSSNSSVHFQTIDDCENR